MKGNFALAALTLTLGAGFTHQGLAQAHEVTLDRAHLPMPNTVRSSLVTYDAKNPDTKFPPIAQLRPPKGAPNVLIVLIDDAGFGSSATFGVVGPGLADTGPAGDETGGVAFLPAGGVSGASECGGQ